MCASGSGSATIHAVRPWSGGVLVPSVNHTTTPPCALQCERTTRTRLPRLVLVGRTSGRPKSVPTTSVVSTGSPAGRLDVDTVTVVSGAGAAGRTGLAAARCTAAFRLIPHTQRQAASPTARVNGWADVETVVIGASRESGPTGRPAPDDHWRAPVQPEGRASIRTRVRCRGKVRAASQPFPSGHDRSVPLGAIPRDADRLRAAGRP